LLELLAYVTRTLSLGLRLAVNMITGHILAKVVIGFIWAMAVAHSWLLLIIAITLITLFISLEILIAFILPRGIICGLVVMLKKIAPVKE